jgi:hypothetical protein
MADLRSILTDPNYTGANAATKRAIFERYSAQDPNYVNANEATKKAIQAKYGVSAVAAAPVMTPEEQAMAIADSAAPAAPAPAPAQPQRQFIGQSIPQAITAPIELAATGLTGATTGVLGYGAGGVAGLLESIRNGTYGTSVGGNLMAQRAMEGLQRYTYQPRTELAQQALQTVGEVAEAAKLAPVPVTAVPQALAQGAVQQARATVPAVAAQTAQAAGRAADIVRRPEAAAANIGVDESAAMRMPSIQYRIEPEATPPLVAGTVADQISSVINAKKQEYKVFGLRVISKEDQVVKPGDKLQPSRQWRNGAPTRRILSGTSAAKVGKNVPVEDALNTLGALGTPGRNGYYYGDQVVLIAGDAANPGADVGESLIKNAVVLDVWEKPTAGLSAVQPKVLAPATAAKAVPPGSVGAAATEQALQRATTAEMMPVPFTGGSALTKGQASRDFAQLQFEKETAKLQEVGAPLRERVQNQSATLLQNFDAMVDSMQPITLSKPEIGLAVTTAIQNKANVAKKRIRAEYKKAEEAGETEEPVSMAPVAKSLEDLDKYSGLVSIIPAFRREAERLGAVAVDESGALVPQELSINNAEILRQFVNQGTDWANPREAKFAKQLVMAIDESTEPAGGEIYRRARNLRRQYAEEFENVGLTSALLGTKGNTSERKIAVENVFDKVIRLSPVEEMNKVRATLISAGPEGKRAWTDLKAKGIDFIKESSLTSARDERGNFTLSPSALHKTIKAMDQTGKLEALYGKKQAQTLRDLSEIALDIYTAPPGAINMSNTGSAMMNALDTVLTYGFAGLPIPGKQVLLEATQYVRNRQTRARVKDALAGPTREKE